MNVYVYIYMYVCMYAFVNVYGCVFLCMCVYICIFVCVRTCVFPCAAAARYSVLNAFRPIESQSPNGKSRDTETETKIEENRKR